MFATQMGDGLIILWGADMLETEKQSFLKEQIWWKSFTRHILMPLYGRFVGFNRSAAYLNPPLFFFFQLYPQMKALLCHVWSCVSPCAASPVSTLPRFHLFLLSCRLLWYTKRLLSPLASLISTIKAAWHDVQTLLLRLRRSNSFPCINETICTPRKSCLTFNPLRWDLLQLFLSTPRQLLNLIGLKGFLSISSLSTSASSILLSFFFFFYLLVSLILPLSISPSQCEIPSVDLIQSAPGVMLVFQSSELPIPVGNVAQSLWESLYSCSCVCVCVSLCVSVCECMTIFSCVCVCLQAFVCALMA